MFLTSGYALGMAIPFLLLGLMFERATRVVHRLRPHLRAIEIISGLLLIGMGLLLLTDQLIWISAWAQRNGWYLDAGLAGADTHLLRRDLRWLLSFCRPVPLVPAYLGYLGGRSLGNWCDFRSGETNVASGQVFVKARYISRSPAPISPLTIVVGQDFRS
jgi:cytochrome c-type biogenesis protein